MLHMNVLHGTKNGVLFFPYAVIVCPSAVGRLKSDFIPFSSIKIVQRTQKTGEN